MGKDIDSILSNPIGQPLATVRVITPTVHSGLTLRFMLDILQQLRKDRHTCFMGIHRDRAVHDGFERGMSIFIVSDKLDNFLQNYSIVTCDVSSVVCFRA